jgi:L-lactate transport
MTTVWQQTYFPWGQSLTISALIAAVPTLLVLFLLGVKRQPAWKSALAGLGATLILAATGYGMSFRHALSSGLYGAAFGLFPISWIVFWAIVLYRVTVETGKFELIKQSVSAVTSDMRMQILLVAFAFGAFLEGGAGFGTPVAVAAAMMVGLGFSPLYASRICLLANTAPVAFGAIGIPVITLAAITGLPLSKLSADVGRVCAPVSFLLPSYLIVAAAGRTAMWQVWPAVLVCGATFAGGQFLISNFIGPQLTDILSSLAAIASLIILLRFWRPRNNLAASGTNGAAPTLADSPASSAQSETLRFAEGVSRPSAREIAEAWMPYALLVLFVLAWGYGPIQKILNTVTTSFPWPWLHNEILRMPPVLPKASAYGAMYNFNWLSAAGTSCMFAALLSALLLRMKLGNFFRLLLSVTRQLFLPTVAVSSVIAMAFVMNYCGATGTLGLAFAATGVLFPFFSSLLGWLGVFLTGSDTSSNALFGSLQVITAGRLGFSPALIAASNSAGGVMGKMISVQTIAVAAAATGLTASEQSQLFRFTFKHSIFLASVIGLEVLFYAYVLHIQ